MINKPPHISVMRDETIQALALRDDGVYVDATAGAGGHSAAILQGLGQHGRLIAIDRDPAAIKAVRQRFADDPRVETFHAPFSQLDKVIAGLGLTGKVDGVLLDLGVSSMQLDQPERGFSFMRSGSLDMRMDSASGLTLAEWLAEVDEQQLIKVLREYGEERFAKRIARAIRERHHDEPLTTTLELAELVARANPHHERKKHPATRTFQALRIALNDELGELKRVLAQVIGLLATGGRLVVLSFHSLEDRIVKQFIQEFSQVGADIPLDLPVTETHAEAPLIRVRVGKKPSRAEVQANPRSRSAIMRVAQRTRAEVQPAPFEESTESRYRRTSPAGKPTLFVGAVA